MPETYTARDIARVIDGLQQQLAALEAEINPIKVERDAFLAAHRDVYAQERAYAERIKALQAQVAPIWADLKTLRDLVAGKAPRS